MGSGIPEGHHSVQPYLIFKSSVAAIEFYAKAWYPAKHRFDVSQEDLERM